MNIEEGKTALNYLFLIYNQPDQKLSREKFLPWKEVPFNFLLENEFIELEEGNYVLEPDTYDHIEKGTLEGRLITLAGIDFDLWNEVDYNDGEHARRELSYKIVEPDKKPEKAPFLSNTRPGLIGSIFLIILLILWWLYFYLTS